MDCHQNVRETGCTAKRAKLIGNYQWEKLPFLKNLASGLIPASSAVQSPSVVSKDY